MSSHYYDTPLPESKLPPTIWTDDTSVGDTPTSGDSSGGGSGFSGAFSKDFDSKGFLKYFAANNPLLKKKEEEDPYKPFTVGGNTGSGGLSVSAIPGTTNKAFAQWQHPSSTVIPAAQSSGGGILGPLGTIGGAIIGAKFGGLKGAQLGASIGGSLG